MIGEDLLVRPLPLLQPFEHVDDLIDAIGDITASKPFKSAAQIRDERRQTVTLHDDARNLRAGSRITA